jgi:hypothetical protein
MGYYHEWQETKNVTPYCEKLKFSTHDEVLGSESFEGKFLEQNSSQLCFKKCKTHYCQRNTNSNPFAIFERDML